MAAAMTTQPGPDTTTPPSIPAASNRVQSRLAASPRTPVLLALGHVAVAIGTITFFVLLLAFYASTPLSRPPGSLEWLLLLGIIALGAAQIVAVARLLDHRRAFLRGDLSPTHLCAIMRRVGWTMGLALGLMVLGMNSLAQLTPPLPLIALLGALVLASLLLDHTHAGWTYQHLPRWGPPVRVLPAGSGTRIRSGQTVAPVFLVLLAAATFVILANTVHTTEQTTDTPLAARLLGLLSAAAVTLLAVLLIRPVLGVGRAIHHDTVHLPTLDAASRTMHRLGLLGALATVLTTAAISTPGADLLTAAPVIPLIVTVGATVSQLASNTCIHLADPRTLSRRRTRTRRATTST